MSITLPCTDHLVGLDVHASTPTDLPPGSQGDTSHAQGYSHTRGWGLAAKKRKESWKGLPAVRFCGQCKSSSPRPLFAPSAYFPTAWHLHTHAHTHTLHTYVYALPTHTHVHSSCSRTHVHAHASTRAYTRMCPHMRVHTHAYVF